MAKHHHYRHRHIRQKISDMVVNIEAVMLNINNVLTEVSVLVNEIDSITERLEAHYENKVNKREVVLDTNRNRSNVQETSNMRNQPKLTTPSPYMDYTFLDLANDCSTFNTTVQNFTYNEKYPLWIQHDAWKTDNSMSEISEVTAGSETQYGSEDKSWQSISNVGTKTHENVYHFHTTYNTKSKFDEDDVVRYSKCCTNSHNDVSDTYCGVYEHIMEQQLEDIEQLSLTSNQSCESDRDTSEGLSDMSGEFIPTKELPIDEMSQDNQYKNVTVRELSDSCASSCESNSLDLI